MVLTEWISVLSPVQLLILNETQIKLYYHFPKWVIV